MQKTLVSGRSRNADGSEGTPAIGLSPADLSRSTRTWFPLVIPLVALAALTAWSWRKWPDVLIDFGNQLYIPWQLVSGKILYRDLAYLSAGPLSQHLHALVFSLFGVSLSVLVVFNVCLMILFVVLLYRLFLSAADAWTATAVCLVTLLVFSFSQYVGIGNYNYVCPYLYEAFHGLVLSVVGIACLRASVENRRRSWAFIGGLCCGAVFLTKPDLYLALLAALAAALLMQRATFSRGPGHRMAATPLLLAGHAAPIGGLVVYYTTVWDFRGGLKAAAGAWLPVLTTSMPQNAYYRWCLGLDRPWQNLAVILEYFAGCCLIVAFLAVCSRHFVRRDLLPTIVLTPLLLLLLYWAITRFPWELSGEPLVPLMLLSLAVMGRRWWRFRRSAAGDAMVLPLLWAVFALVLLAKMGLNTRIWHYGFYLAMPAAVLTVFCLLWMVPRELSRFGVPPVIFRALIGLFLLIGVFRLLDLSNRYYQLKDLPVGTGGDRILTYSLRAAPEGKGVRQAVDWLRTNTRPDSTVAVLPEGVMINYLARRVNPTPFPVLPAPEFLVHGEQAVMAAYRRHSPDFLVLVHRNSSEFGVGPFGQDPAYGRRMMGWIRGNYSAVWQYGHEPFQTDGFGIKILARKTAANPVKASP